ncbi:MAG: hypothetical protein QM661_09575, partial [Solimonas sp.]
MKSKIGKWLAPVLLVGLGLTACEKTPSSLGQKSSSPVEAPKAVPKLGIRPYGDEEVKIDMGRIHNEDLKKVYQYIDDHIDDHVI